MLLFSLCVCVEERLKKDTVLNVFDVLGVEERFVVDFILVVKWLCLKESLKGIGS